MEKIIDNMGFLSYHDYIRSCCLLYASYTKDNSDWCATTEDDEVWNDIGWCTATKDVETQNDIGWRATAKDDEVWNDKGEAFASRFF